MQKKLFAELGLSPDLLKAVEKMGYEEASPIQSQAIPALLAGSDVVGQSQTGSGKTAAFALPAIEKVEAALHQPQVLILCPTRELAVQVAEEVAKLAAFKKGVAQIIIGTPGRVMDHLRRGTLKKEAIKMLILDEADRMLDMGFLDDIRTVLSQMPKERQTVFFSATMPRPIQDLIKTFTNKPVNISITDQAMVVPAIDQVYYEVDRRAKVEVLCRLIDIQDIKFGLIFCATKMMVDDLVEHLKARGYAADKMHGDMTQAQREKVIAKFRKRGLEFLVATDVAARGLDVDDIEVVFNYDLPHDGEDYVHRIGRTGRAGRSGRAITFVAGREIYKLQDIIRFTKARIRCERAPSEDEVEEKRTNTFMAALEETLKGGKFKKHDDVIKQLLDQNYTPTDIASALIHVFTAPLPKPAVAAAPERAPRTERPEGRREDRPRYDRPQRSEDRPPRQDRSEGRRDDRAPRQDPRREHDARFDRAPRQYDRPQRSDAPPRREYASDPRPPRADRPAYGAPSADRGPRPERAPYSSSAPRPDRGPRPDRPAYGSGPRQDRGPRPERPYRSGPPQRAERGPSARPDRAAAPRKAPPAKVAAPPRPAGPNRAERRKAKFGEKSA
jgi:ATP-dependent RNA helicase DeaD